MFLVAALPEACQPATLGTMNRRHGLTINLPHELNRKEASISQCGRPGLDELSCLAQLNSRHPTKVNIEQKTIDVLGLSAVEKILGRGEQWSRKSSRVQEVRCGFEHA